MGVDEMVKGCPTGWAIRYIFDVVCDLSVSYSISYLYT